MYEITMLNTRRNIIGGYSSPVHEKGWVQEIIANHKEIIKFNNVTEHLDKERNFGNRIALTFVTPWNEKGYKWTEMYAHKFTHISPVWFEIQPLINSFIVTGTDNVNSEWIKAVYANNKKIQFIPRIALNGQHWNTETIQKFLKSKSMQKEFTKVLIKTMKNNVKNSDVQFNGFVLEMLPFFNYFASVQQQFNDGTIARKQLIKTKRKFIKWIESMSKRLRKSKRYIFLVLSPFHTQLFNFNVLCKYFKGIVLMTYDYSTNQGKKGPIAPLNWMQSVVENVKTKLSAKHEWKLLLGINFYGYKYAKNEETKVVIGDELIDLLRKYGDDYEWKWDESVFEHYLVHKDKEQIIYYPTLKSLADRIEFASLSNIGISIWEIGQGMEYFTDLL